MSHSYANFLYRIVFSTKNREPLITADLKPRLYEYMGRTLRKQGGIALAINGVEDHVHLLAKLRPDKAVTAVIRDLKANSSGWLHDVFPKLKDFSWQRGYGAFTVSESLADKVRNYIANQEQHHEKSSFRDEFIKLLIANGIEFDERYLFS